MLSLKHILMFVLLLSLTAVPYSSAQEADTIAVAAEMEKASYSCRILQASLKAPYYFCDCYEGASTFRFTLSTQISDTV